MKPKGKYTVVGAGVAVVAVAACAMVSFFPQIVEKQCLRNLSSQNEGKRIGSLKWLREKGSARTIPYILEVIRNDHSADRLERYSPIFQKLKVSEETVPLLYCLVDITKRHRKSAVPRLRQAVVRDDPILRYVAASLLSRIGSDGRHALPDLITALADSDDIVRAVAAEALGNIGPTARAAIPALKTTLKDRNEEVRVWAVISLRKIRMSLKRGEAPSETAADEALKRYGGGEDC